MSWVSKFGKPQHESVMDITENDIPLKDVSFMRIGAAHAKEHTADREALVGLLEKFIEQVNVPFDGNKKIHRLDVLNLSKEGN